MVCASPIGIKEANLKGETSIHTREGLETVKARFVSESGKEHAADKAPDAGGPSKSARWRALVL